MRISPVEQKDELGAKLSANGVSFLLVGAEVTRVAGVSGSESWSEIGCRGISDPVCPESGPEPGRLSESLPAGGDPGTRPAGTTAPRTAPGTPGGAGGSADAGPPETCEEAVPRDRDTRNKPARTDTHITFITSNSGSHFQ